MCPPVSSSAQQAAPPARSAGHNTSPNIALALLSPTPPTRTPSQASHPHWDKKSTVNGAERVYIDNAFVLQKMLNKIQVHTIRTISDVSSTEIIAF